MDKCFFSFFPQKNILSFFNFQVQENNIFNFNISYKKIKKTIQVNINYIYIL